MRQLRVRRPVLVGLNAVAVLAAALALTGASGARSSSSAAPRGPLSGAPALKQADAARLDIGAVIETVKHDVAPAPETTSNPDILAPPDRIVGESGEINGHVDLTVTLSDQSDSPVSVHYATANSTATAGTVCGNGADYVAVSGTLNFAPGETTKTVPVQIVDCPNVEGFEAFTFDLSTAINGDDRPGEQLGSASSTTTRSCPRRSCSCAMRSSTRRTATRSCRSCWAAPQARPRTARSPSTTRPRTERATEGDDYTRRRATRSRFAPGETAKTVAVPIVDDGAAEGQESFVLNLSNAGNADIADRHGDGRRSARATRPIRPTRTFARQPIWSSARRTGSSTCRSRLSAPSLNPVSVEYSTVNSTASAGHRLRQRRRLHRRLRHAQLRARGDDQGRARADRRLPRSSRAVRGLHVRPQTRSTTA